MAARADDVAVLVEYDTTCVEESDPAVGIEQPGGARSCSTPPAVSRAAAPPSTRPFVQELVRAHRRDDRLMRLTDREREALAQIAEGRSNRAIAERLGITTKTLEG